MACEGATAMRAALILALVFGSVGFAGSSTQPKPRLSVVGTADLLRINSGSGILVSAALVADSETGREWLIVSGVANTHVHVAEIRK